MGCMWHLLLMLPPSIRIMARDRHQSPVQRTMYSNTKKSSSFSRITSFSCTMQGWCSLRRLRTCSTQACGGKGAPEAYVPAAWQLLAS